MDVTLIYYVEVQYIRDVISSEFRCWCDATRCVMEYHILIWLWYLLTDGLLKIFCNAFECLFGSWKETYNFSKPLSDYVQGSILYFRFLDVLISNQMVLTWLCWKIYDLLLVYPHVVAKQFFFSITRRNSNVYNMYTCSHITRISKELRI